MNPWRVSFPAHLRVGTSSWSSPDWRGSFYPDSIDPADMIAAYAQRLLTVEIDSTWYRIPSESAVDGWNERTPSEFKFSAKVPRIISHDKYLVDCEAELCNFVSVMARLGDKLGPLVLQFPYVAKAKDPAEYAGGADFLSRLKRFAAILPSGFSWVIEIRNSNWVRNELLDLLHARNLSLAFIDYYTMDPLPRLAAREGIITASFAYVRFLGNHKQMDAAVEQACKEGKRNSNWDSLIVDRSAQMRTWIAPIRKLVNAGTDTYVYFNNHYAGYAPGSVELFSDIWNHEDPN